MEGNNLSPRIKGMMALSHVNLLYKMQGISKDEKQYLLQQIREYQKTGNGEEIINFLSEIKTTVGKKEVNEILALIKEEKYEIK